MDSFVESYAKQEAFMPYKGGALHFKAELNKISGQVSCQGKEMVTIQLQNKITRHPKIENFMEGKYISASDAS